jgi:hypothetical protein
LRSRLPQKGHVKCSLQSYRAQAAEFRGFLTDMPRSPNEMSEIRDLEQAYTTLAENEEWMAVHVDRTIQRRKNRDNRTALAEEEEQILKCLGAAVLMHWNMEGTGDLPTRESIH